MIAALTARSFFLLRKAFLALGFRIFAQQPDKTPGFAFAANVYHHLEDRSNYFKSSARYLKPHGRVAIIDINGSSWIHRLFGHWTAEETSRREMEAAGYTLAQDFDFLSRQNFQVFAKES